MISFDLSDFQRAARQIRALEDQIPFAISRALNDAATVTREALISETWPRYVEVRNRNFMRAALRTEFATKKKLSVAIFDRLGRAHLKKHDTGGVKQARGMLAIPSEHLRARRRSRGVPVRPGALPNSFRKGDAIFQRVGRGGRKLRLMYVLKPSAPIPADVPFTREFERLMRQEVHRAFSVRIREAMATRRR